MKKEDVERAKAVKEEVDAAKTEGRAPNVRLWGWKVRSVGYFKDGNIPFEKKEWQPEEVADVPLPILEQLEASAGLGNWERLERIHVPA